jgi:hypothetical protein
VPTSIDEKPVTVASDLDELNDSMIIEDVPYVFTLDVDLLEVVIPTEASPVVTIGPSPDEGQNRSVSIRNND